jgi:carboxymethylenebutenolidase
MSGTPVTLTSTPGDRGPDTAQMRVHVLRPSGAHGAPLPAVIFCMDALGMRASLVQMAQRIADFGYVVAAPDLFHRGGDVLDLVPPGAPRETKSLFGIFGNQDLRAQWGSRFYAPATNPDNLRADIGAVLAHLDSLPDVKKGGLGTTGYCMGGNVSLRLASLFPDRVAACASFHGGGIAKDAPESPHHEANKFRARVNVAGAVEDATFTDEDKQRLISALAAAHVDNTVETYPAKHGFAVPDHINFDAAAAERHYAALQSLYGRALA